MINLKEFEDLQKAYNEYVDKNTIENKNIYIIHIDNCISILQKKKIITKTINKLIFF